MSLFEEDNNPFAGSDHLFASGIDNHLQNGSKVNTSSVNNTDNNSILSPSLLTKTSHASSSLQSPHASFLQDQYDNDLMENAASSGIFQDEYDELCYQESSTTPLQILTANPSIEIDIPCYLQVKDEKGKLIVVYVIKLQNLEIKRRYSDFDKLRQYLRLIYPMVILPSLPNKHSFTNYLLNPLNVQSSNLKFIERRLNGLKFFLNFLIMFQNNIINDFDNLHETNAEDSFLPPMKFHDIFLKFLDPSITKFQDILRLPPYNLLQKTNLLNDPINPLRISPYHQLLPVPPSNNLKNYDSIINNYIDLVNQRNSLHEELSNSDWKKEEFLISIDDFNSFKFLEQNLLKFIKVLNPILSNWQNSISPLNKDIISNLSKLGAYFNGFSLEYDVSMTFEPVSSMNFNDTHDSLSPTSSEFKKIYNLSTGIEKIGQSIDNEFINLEILQSQIESSFQIPLTHLNKLLKNIILELVNFHKLKNLQLLLVNKRLLERNSLIEEIENIDSKYLKLEQILKSNLNASETIKNSYNNLQQRKRYQEQQLDLFPSDSNVQNREDDLGYPENELPDENAEQIIDRASISSITERSKENVVSSPFWFSSLFGSSSNSKNSNNLKNIKPERLTKSQRIAELNKLKKDRHTLVQLSEILKVEIGKISENLKINISNFLKFFKISILKLFLQFSKIYKKFIAENLKFWKMANSYILENIHELQFNVTEDRRLPKYQRSQLNTTVASSSLRSHSHDGKNIQDLIDLHNRKLIMNNIKKPSPATNPLCASSNLMNAGDPNSPISPGNDLPGSDGNNHLVANRNYTYLHHSGYENENDDDGDDEDDDDTDDTMGDTTHDFDDDDDEPW